jgi:hypothetical protein
MMYHKPSYAGIQNEDMFNKLDFLICRSCFWCASAIAKKSMVIMQCPSCDSNLIESIPIGPVDEG